VAQWLLKEEPTHYSWSDLVRDGRTQWEGVHNALALRHLRSMASGDRALYYHTGSERACVGLVRVTSGPRPDRSDPRGSWSVTVAPVRPLRRAISLAEIRADPALAGLDLLRIPRLSVVPLSDDQWSRLLSHEDVRAWPPVGTTGAARGRGGATPSRPKRTGARRTR
jgi:predicted RNA-binding protein with PUA-like domain